MTKPAYESKWQFQQKYVQQNCATGAGTGDFLQSVISQNKVLKKERKREKKKKRETLRERAFGAGIARDDGNVRVPRICCPQNAWRDAGQLK